MSVDDSGNEVLRKSAVVLDGGAGGHTTKGSEYYIRVSDINATSGTVARSIANISLGPINTEQTYTLPIGAKSYLIRTRGASELKLAFVVTESGTKYITIPKRSSFNDCYAAGGLTLYFQSPQSSDVVEILTWS